MVGSAALTQGGITDFVQGADETLGDLAQLQLQGPVTFDQLDMSASGLTTEQFAEALGVAPEELAGMTLDQLEQKNPAAKSKLFEKIEDVTTGIRDMPWKEIDEIKIGLQPAKVDCLVSLHEELTTFLESIGTIKSGR